jgi:site-specific DNA recombinase
MSTSKRAVLYARTSGDDRERDSLSSQLEMCRTYAHDLGYSVVAEFSEDERGVSGADLDAPELRRVLDLAHSGDFDVLVTREMDRLARSLAKQMIVQDGLERAGVEIDYVLADYDDTPEGQLQRNVRAVVAEFERLKIAERMERGRTNAAKAGNVMLGSTPPFGWRKVETDSRRSLVPDPDESRWVKQIFRWYVQGDGESARLSLYAIAAKLTELRVLTAVDRGSVAGVSKKESRGVWSPSTVRNILVNSVNHGEWTYDTRHGERIVVAVPPLVDRATFRAAQIRLSENKRMSRRKTKHEYLLRSRVKCGICGRQMTGRFTSRYPYYMCYGRWRSDCTSRQVRLDRLEPTVWDLVAGKFSDLDALRLAYDEWIESQKEGVDHERIGVVTKRVKRLETRLLRLRDVYLDGDISRADYQSERKGLRADLDRWRDELERLTAVDVGGLDPETFVQFGTAVQTAIAGATEFKERRWYIETLNVEVVVREDRKADVMSHGVRLGTVDFD